MSAGPLPTVEGGFKFVAADPAWRYLTYDKKKAVPSRTADDPYPTMSLEELKALPLAEVCAKDCVLVMWVISSHVDQAIDLGRALGFKFKSLGPIWAKTPKHGPKPGKARHLMGMGKWFRQEAEIALLFTRGKPRRRAGGGGVRQIIEAPRREHSRKPDEQFERYERLVEGPYLELFARQERPGWAVWGDQIGKFEGE